MRRGLLLDALGADRASQAAAQAALLAAREAWRSDKRTVAMIAELSEYGAGGVLGQCSGLLGVFTDRGRAAAMVDAFLGRMLPAMAEHWLGQVPARHGNDGGVRTLVLAREGRALLSLVAREPGRYHRRAAGFADCERHEIVLAGKANGRIVRRRGEKLECRPVLIAPGSRFAFDEIHEGLVIDEVDTRLVGLRVVRVAERPAPTREYALDSGELLHQSAGDPGESRFELMLALLGRMGRRDAAPAMAWMTREGSDHLRWEALRECIALDTAEGLRALRTITHDRSDTLHGPAVALLDRLYVAHPALRAFEPA